MKIFHQEMKEAIELIFPPGSMFTVYKFHGYYMGKRGTFWEYLKIQF
jgi:hypothetical protein